MHIHNLYADPNGETHFRDIEVECRPRSEEVSFVIDSPLERDGFELPVPGKMGGRIGKTTILNALTGLVRPRAGSIRLEGTECAGRRPDEIVRLGMAQVPQGREVFASMSVIDNLEMGAVTRRDRPAIARDIDEVLTSFPALRQKHNARAGGLSGGEQQMVAIVRALLSRPRCLLMDEPSAGLSPVMVNVLVDMILGLHERGLTILLVEQNVGVAAALADSAHVLQHGEIVFSVPLLVSSTRPRSCNPISDADRLCFSTEVGPHP
jgi:branched-chain amino acid transport system ATP-binding protein